MEKKTTTYLDRDGIVKRIADEAGVKIKDMSVVYSTTIKVLSDILSELGDKEKIVISGVGTFEGCVREGTIIDKEYKSNGIKFKLSPTLKDKRNGRYKG